MKRLALLALILAACSQQATPPVQTQRLAEVTQKLADLAPIVVSQPAAPADPAPTDPPVTFGGPEQSWVEVTAAAALRPSTGGPCTATAYLRPDNRVEIDPVGCASGQVRLVIDDGAHQTPQTVGDWYLIVTQRAQGIAVAEPTFKVFSGDQQLWP